MKLSVLIFMILNCTFASQLIALDDIEGLFKKLMTNELTEYNKTTIDDLFEVLHRPEHISSKSIEYNSASRMTIDCFVCRSIFAAAIESIHNGQSDEEITAIITTLCTSLGIENYRVCRGAIELNIPIIAHIVRTIPEATAGAFCNLAFQSGSNPNSCPYNDQRFEWQVELTEPVSMNPAPIVDTNPLTVAIITDAHIDPLYEAFGVANCDEPVCCRKGQSPSQGYVYQSNIDESITKQSIVNVSGELMLDLDVAAKMRDMRKMSQTRFVNRNSEPAGYWGDYRNCDTPIWAFDDVIERIAETHKNIDVLYYIGDTIDHGVWETSYDLINEMNLYVIDKIRKTLGDNVLVIPVIGNHESQPTNQFAPSSVTGEKLNTTWLYNALVDKWSFYLNDEAKVTLRERGEYSILVRPGLRVITLNNNVAYRSNWWLVYDPFDAKKHLDWLVEELTKAELAGEKVHILAHIPPGVNDLTYTWTREYNRIVNRFSSTIKAQFNGHTHTDEFKIFYDAQGIPINVAWGAGSTTSYTFYNINYKIATIDPATYEPLNIVNYVYNLTEANLIPNRRPHWFELYDMINSFTLPDLSSSSMNDLIQRMVTSDKHLLDLYAAFYSKLSDSRWPSCGTNCKLDILCKSVVTVLWENERCEELNRLYAL